MQGQDTTDELLSTIHMPTFVGSVVMFLFWTVVICTGFGLCGLLITGNAIYLKAGFITGIIFGGGLSFTFMVWVVVSRHRLLDYDPPTHPQTTITYAPLGTQPTDNIRIVPLRAYDKMIDKVPARDLAWFCRGLSKNYPHTQRTWVGKTAPSGQLVDALYWKALCNPLLKAGIIKDMEPRKSGTLTTKNLDTMMSIIGLDPNDPDLWLLGPGTDL